MGVDLAAGIYYLAGSAARSMPALPLVAGAIHCYSCQMALVFTGALGRMWVALWLPRLTSRRPWSMLKVDLQFGQVFSELLAFDDAIRVHSLTPPLGG